MKDALGSVQSVLILGGGSDIAVATAERLAAQRAKTVVLAGRKVEALAGSVAAIKAAGATTCEAIAFDALDFASHSKFVDDAFEKYGSFDLVLVAFGLLGDQETDEADPLAAVKVVESNYTGAVSVMLSLAQRLRKQGHGSIVVLSSVAGERARSANYIYGSSKAGIDAFSQGLGDSLVGSGVSLMVVRPGFVKTKMTEHMGEKPMASTAGEVADAIVNGIGKGSEIIWVPGKLRVVFSIFRHMPRPIFRKIKA